VSACIGTSITSVVARLLVLLAAVGVIGAATPAVSQSAHVPPGVRRCAPQRSTAASIDVLLHRARARLGQADGVVSVRVGAPPRFYWGRSYPPTHRRIRRRSAWVYVTVPPNRPQNDEADVAAQRGAWQADLLIQSLHASICAAGQRPEAGYSLVTPDGSRAATSSAGGAIQSFPRSYAWPFATMNSAFTDRLTNLGRRYSFHVVSLVVLHGLGDAPQIRVESDHPAALIRNLSAIELALYQPTSDCWTSSSCFNGEWLEGVDKGGRPFVATGGATAIGTGVGSWGSQWVRPGLNYPYAHGEIAPPTIAQAPKATQPKSP
jgi:hypothetical protein